MEMNRVLEQLEDMNHLNEKNSLSCEKSRSNLVVNRNEEILKFIGSYAIGCIISMPVVDHYAFWKYGHAPDQSWGVMALLGLVVYTFIVMAGCVILNFYVGVSRIRMLWPLSLEIGSIVFEIGMIILITSWLE
jgi:hypothetical protein